jgi:glyoxylase-like metal-dependent hydrolase (beta-lactamase superfamily II)
MASVHQRAAWRLRRELGIPVWVPAATRQAEEEPDERYSEGDRLPGRLDAIFTPGAGTTQHTVLDRARRAAFVSDLLVRPRGGRLALLSESLAHDPAQLRKTVEIWFLRAAGYDSGPKSLFAGTFDLSAGPRLGHEQPKRRLSRQHNMPICRHL